MKILINYANEEYRKAQKWNTWTGRHIARFDKIYEFTPDDIDDEYYTKHKDVLSVKRGNGLWLWKPYFINRVLNESNDGDVIFYADSGALFLKNIDVLIASMKNEKMWVSDNPLLESCFTKKVCFEKMGCNSPEFKCSNQIQATYLMFRCCSESKEFVKEWLKWCEDYELISPEGGLSLSEYKGEKFVAHREDQSILSLLCKKKGIVPHKDPSQRGKYVETFFNPMYAFQVPEHPDDLYGTVIFLHKAKSIKLTTLIKQAVNTIRSKRAYKKWIQNY